MNSLVLIKLAQVLTLRDKLLLDWFAILMLLVLSFFSVPTAGEIKPGI